MWGRLLSFDMQVPRRQFFIFSVLTLSAILWLLLLTCFREYWGFWQSPDTYHFLTKEYPVWFRSYIWNAYDLIFYFTVFVYLIWLFFAWQRMSSSRCVCFWIIAMSLLMGFALGVLCANNLIGLLNDGQLHGRTGLPIKPPK
jgi:dolichol kinase